MQGRVKELYYEYCIPKPAFKFEMFDTEVKPYPEDDSEEGKEQAESINFYVNLVL